MLKLYKTATCPVCVDLMSLLDSMGQPFKVLFMEDPAVLTDLRLEIGCVMRAPILEDEGRFLLPEKMVLPGNRLFKQAVEDFLNGEDR